MKTGPASSVEEAVEVEWPREEYEWLEAHPCLCGGVWVFVRQGLVASSENERGSRMTDRVDVRCATCGRRATRYFVVQYDGPLAPPG